MSTPNSSALEAPGNLLAESGDSFVTLTWSAPANSTGSLTYTILRGTSSGGEGFLTSTKSTSYTDTSVTNNTIYYYEVEATDAAGTTALSSEVSTLPPYGLVTVSWIGAAAQAISGFQMTATQTAQESSGDGMFWAPNDVAIDSTDGYFYVVDHQRVEKFNLNTGAFIGAIGAVNGPSTGTCPSFGATKGWCTGGIFVGGSGDGMIGQQSAAIEVDSTNNALYVADTTNHRVSKYVLSTGVYVGSIGDLSGSTGTCPSSGAASGWCTGGTFVSGTGDGEFTEPSSLALDTTNGFLFVGDNYSVSRFDLESGVFLGSIGDLSASTGNCPSSGAASGWCFGGTFKSGTGDGMFSNPLSMIADPANGYLYVGDSSRVSRYLLNSGAFDGNIGGVTASTGTCPSSGAASGWCTGGTFTFGSGDGYFEYPDGLALDSSGDLYIAESNNPRVDKIIASTGAFVGAAGDLSASTGTCPSSGPSSNWCTGGSFASNGSGYGFENLSGMAFDSNSGSLYIADQNANRVDKLAATTGQFKSATGGSLTEASGWATSSPTFVSGVSGSEDGMFEMPSQSSGLAVDSTNGYIYVSNGTSIDKFNLSTGTFVGAIGYLSGSTGTCASSGAANGWCTGGTFVASKSDGGFAAIAALAIDSADNALYALDALNGTGMWPRVEKFNLSTGAFVGAIGYSSGTTGTCSASPGFTSGWCTGGKFQQGGGVEPYFEVPWDLAVDPTNGYLYVVDEYAVDKFNLSTGAYIGSIGDLSASSGTCPSTGPATTWCTGGTFAAASVDGGFEYADGIALNVADDLFYIGDYSGNRIDKFALSTGAFIGSVGDLSGSTGTCPSTGVATTWCTGGTFTSGTGDGAYNFPAYLALSASAGRIYIDDISNNRIVMVDAATGSFLGALGDTSNSSGTCPDGGVATTWCTGGKFISSSAQGGFNTPEVLTLDSSGNLYVSDVGNYRIERLIIH